jgi:hypothetical protein
MSKLLYLIPIALGIVATAWMINNLYELNTGIIDRLDTPTNIDVLPDYMNHDVYCHKIGLYTDWDEYWSTAFSEFVTGIHIGEHARKLFFENDCSLTCYKYWESNKICLGELYK